MQPAGVSKSLTRSAVRVRLVRPLPTLAVALQSLRSPSGARLHALDDEVYLDPSGFWVKGASRARFVLETPNRCAKGCALHLCMDRGHG